MFRALEKIRPRFARLVKVLLQAPPLPLEFGFRGFAADQCLDGDGERAVPIFVECRRQLGNQRTRHEHIVIGVLRIGIYLKVGIADIAPPDQRRRIVGDEQFVVHSIIEAALFGQELERAHHPQVAAVSEWIEDPHFHLWVGRQPQDLLVTFGGLAVIDQHPDMHPPVGCSEQRAGQQEARVVRREDVILNVQAVLRGLHHLHSRRESVGAHGQHPKRRLIVVIARILLKHCTEARVLRAGERRRRLLRESRARRQRRATGHCGQRNGDRNTAKKARHYDYSAHLRHPRKRVPRPVDLSVVFDDQVVLDGDHMLRVARNPHGPVDFVLSTGCAGEPHYTAFIGIDVNPRHAGRMFRRKLAFYLGGNRGILDKGLRVRAVRIHFVRVTDSRRQSGAQDQACHCNCSFHGSNSEVSFIAARSSQNLTFGGIQGFLHPM